MLARFTHKMDYEKERNVLGIFLKDFLGEEKGKSVGLIPSDFFDIILRMKGWTWERATTKKLLLIGNYVDNYVYSRLSKDAITGKNKKGLKGDSYSELREYLNILIAFAVASGYNWNNWVRMVERVFPKQDLPPDDL